MVRKLEHNGQKILKKIVIISSTEDNNLNEVKVMKQFYIKKRGDYTRYNKLARDVRDIADKIKALDPTSDFKTELSDKLLEKLYQMGLIPTRWDLSLAANVSASSFCRRRLPVIMALKKMCENLKEATNFIEQGHICVGPVIVKDPAFLVSRALEDFVTWVDGSATMEYNDMMDDF